MSNDPLHQKNFLERWLLRIFHGGSETEEVALREFLLVGGVAVLIIVAAFWLTFRFVRPAPPSEFVISTGGPTGAYELFGERYAKFLAREKITVKTLVSSGSVENLERLANPASGVGVAFMQGGVGNPEQHPDLVTLAALYYEPFWVFYRDTAEWTLLTDFVGKRVAIGPDGSGTRVMALMLSEVSGVAERTKELLPLGGSEAADALISGKIDAAVFVAGPESAVVQRLLHAPGVRLMNLKHAEGLARRFPYLATVTLPRGVLDFARDQPPQDTRLVATTAYLVARDDFHPALVSVLLDAATRIHRGGTVFSRPGEFPAAREGDFPLSDAAERYFKSGPPFLQRYMPFWVANLIQRLLILLVPLIAVVIPVMRIFPGVYAWRVRMRVFRWYRALRAVELEAQEGTSPERLRQLASQLHEIEDHVSRTRVPLRYSDYAYNLKLHIDLVRLRLERLAARSESKA